MASPFRVPTSELRPPISLALLEIGNLSPAIIAADHCAKAAGVRIVAIESTDSTAQCIKLAGSAEEVREAAEAGAELGRRMGTTAFWTWLPGPRKKHCGWRTSRLLTVPCWAATTPVLLWRNR